MSNAGEARPRPGVPQALWIALAANFIWINLSEIFRYFAFVMPMMREAFPAIADVAPMNGPIFLMWGLWDTILVASATALSWLMLERFGPTLRSAALAGTAIWATVFLILWLGLWNMNLATAKILGVALPLAWIELFVAALIVRWVQRR